VGSIGINDYCAFSKAVEYLGDRWSLPILAQLALFGPRGFNDFAGGLPGNISRSVLAEKLRKLEDLGLISRESGNRRSHPYRLTAAGNGLAPTIWSLRGWAEAWLPADMAMVERDPDIVLGWLTTRVDSSGLPDRMTVAQITMHHENEHRCWLVLARGAEPYGCLEDPLLDEARYVYVEGGTTAIVALARGRRGWQQALADGSITAFGDPELVRQLPAWFRPVDQSVPEDAPRPGARPSRVGRQHSPASSV
jgi:DNA-binding HxlR family transcriptional regulator